jgi:hypothetical protein
MSSTIGQRYAIVRFVVEETFVLDPSEDLDGRRWRPPEHLGERKVSTLAFCFSA